MYFDVYGPFELVRNGKCVSSKQREMWKDVRQASLVYGNAETELEAAIGCYAFGLQHGETVKPWYIGMTMARRGFRGEILQPHKLNHYNRVTGDHKGAPVLMLMPLLTSDGRFSHDRTTSGPLIQWVEKMLFGLALKRNPDCLNMRDTKFLRNVTVHGIFNSRPRGRPGPEARFAQKMFGKE